MKYNSTAKTEAMFKFSTKLFFNKNKITRLGEVALYLEIYISTKGNYARERLPLDLRWPVDRIDLQNSTLLPRMRDDQDVNDYNMIILSERAKHNEIAKMYRLSNRIPTVKDLKRELIFADSKKSVVAYFEFRRKELYRMRAISYQTYKNYGTTNGRIEEFQLDVRFDQVNKKWMDKFKAYLKAKGNAHNTVWTRLKDVKALLKVANDETTIYVDPAAIEYENRYTETPTTFLNRDEIRELLTLVRSNTLKDEDQNVLKAFLFSCFTSLRISDIYEANQGWMLSENFLMFTMVKNRQKKPKKIKIPIASIAKEFISTTLNQFFKLPTQQEYNRTLKDIAIAAGIKKNLTSHVGRHTFGYIFMTSVGDIYALKEIMGHSKIETTQRYAHLDEDYKLEQVMKIGVGFV
ncbi:site-specific integrase [Sphingobacterium alkalisoli]|uniref:Site-specific integrase n=1 Tax=Sphingobacterium alkalisoli TaxID=1874115 RepID=A0A4V5LXI2_9SPHI|nr:site-specific integrase [Sphingobacterium alkalisoli]TJY62679.1 site-specific integrase [Sphingobacterium alkalisoli]GGH28175.1 transposase [Sphingobacterium alkalisoli]